MGKSPNEMGNCPFAHPLATLLQTKEDTAAWIYYVMTVMIIILCTCVGCLLYAKYSQCDPLRAKLISKPDQIVLQIFDAFATPILDVYLLGFFAPRVQSRSVLIAFLLCLIFQMWVLVGATVTVKPHLRQRGRLPTSIVGCIPSVNMSVSTSINERPNPLTSLFSISPLWYSFNGVFITFILGLIFASIFESKDSRPVDRSLLISPSEIFPFCSSKPVSIIITYLV
ncbi:unnamed protein product [Rotaria sordida]|uniref:Uncharacterized protein n=1 Tax=Rotaria sordida TaxID=392033 RepID=A0A815KQJ0_9BILA|nr:unnamed protein product [Rotaria sordida]